MSNYSLFLGHSWSMDMHSCSEAANKIVVCETRCLHERVDNRNNLKSIILA